MSIINKTSLKSKFRGCLLGLLVGDCFGAPFIGDSLTTSSRIVLQKYFDKLDGPFFKAPVKKCTKNTVMTKCVIESLISDETKLNPVKLAKLFVKEYFTDPKREYEESTINIFHKLRANKFTDAFKPAMEQRGSADNGAAIRTAPIALLYHDDYDTMLNMSKTSTEITHTHKQGVTGSLLHCIAVQQVLLTNPSDNLNVNKFIADIITKLKYVEKDDEGLGIGHPSPFTNQMEIVQELLKNGVNTTDEQVVEQLGHSMMAVYSVPTAIYCFLRAQTEIEHVETRNPFRRTLQYAISLGGDTATISGMAGSIAGAFYGEGEIGNTMVKHCENNEIFSSMADQLHSLKFDQQK